MKKFLAIALIAASFAACNDGEKTETEVTTEDTMVTTPVMPVDTMSTSMDTTTVPMVDTSMNK